MTSFCLRFCIGMLLSGLMAGMATARQSLDMVITDAQVYKMPPDTVIGITDGKFSYLGPLDGTKSLINSATHYIDANGASIYPGFIELHTHLFDTISIEGMVCPLNPERGLSGVEACLALNKKIEPQQWLIGHRKGLLNTTFDGQTPREWLDIYFPDRPVVIFEPHSTVLWLNSNALKRMMINPHSVDPAGRRLHRAAQNKSDGVVLGTLTAMVLEKALATYQIVYSDFLKRYQILAATLQQNGVTSIGESGSLWKHSDLAFWTYLEKTDQLHFRISMRPRLSSSKGMNSQVADLAKMYRNDLSSMFIVNQVMVNVDGQHELGTARLIKPYHHPTLSSEPKGLFYFTPTELNSWLLRLEEIGYGAYIQAEGDAAVEAALYSIQNARRKGDDQRFILAGMHLIKPEQYPLFSQNDVTASILTEPTKSDITRAHSYISEQSQVFSIEKLLAYDSSIVLSSGRYDQPFISPLIRISQSLQVGINDIHRAIDSYTIEPARALGIESITGSIVIGKSADIVMIDKNLASLSVEEIVDAKVLMTMLQGEVMFSTNAQNRPKM